jgi:hypothetical protein
MAEAPPPAPAPLIVPEPPVIAAAPQPVAEPEPPPAAAPAVPVIDAPPANPKRGWWRR